MSSSSLTSSSCSDSTCLARDRLLRICGKTHTRRHFSLFLYVTLWHAVCTFICIVTHGSERFLRAEAISSQQNTLTRSSSSWVSYTNENWMRPLTSTTPKSPELNRLIMLPPSYAAHTQSGDQLLRHCLELSHLALPDSRQLIKCVSVCVCTTLLE